MNNYENIQHGPATDNGVITVRLLLSSKRRIYRSNTLISIVDGHTFTFEQTTYQITSQMKMKYVERPGEAIKDAIYLVNANAVSGPNKGKSRAFDMISTQWVNRWIITGASNVF